MISWILRLNKMVHQTLVNLKSREKRDFLILNNLLSLRLSKKSS